VINRTPFSTINTEILQWILKILLCTIPCCCIQRMFGEFYCQHCHRRWSSGVAWQGKGQQCKTCRRMVLPKSLRPLQSQRTHNSDDEDRKPHQGNLCQMCQELGFNCRQYNPPQLGYSCQQSNPRPPLLSRPHPAEGCGLESRPPPPSPPLPRPSSYPTATTTYTTTYTIRSQNEGCIIL